MKNLLKILMLALMVFGMLAAQETLPTMENFFLAGYADFDPADSTDVRYTTSGHRGLTAGADLDNDGKMEVYAAHYGHGGGVVGFEVTDEGALELMWNSDTTTADASYSSGTRIVQTADLDGDGLGEVIFFRGRYYNDVKAGLYIYESDGTDNGFKEPVFYSVVDLGSRFNFNGETNLTQLLVEYFVVDDVDQDGVEELILASNGPTYVVDRTETTETDTIDYGHSEDMFTVLSATGDLQGLAGDITVEFVTSARDIDMGTVSKDHPMFGRENKLGGGSAICVTVSDVDGDNNKEIFCHAWNGFNNFFVEAVGADEYSFGDTTYVNGMTSGDHVCLMNPTAADLDNDGKDEVYASNYYTGNVWKFIDTDDNATSLSTDEAFLISDTTAGGNIGALFGATAGDLNGDGVDEVYFGGSVGSKGDLIQFDGNNWYAMNTDTVAGGFIAKMCVADMDQDGHLEIVSSHQSVLDSIEVIEGTDTTMIANPHHWSVRVIEYGDSTLAKSVSVKDYAIITPDDYKLENAYPNPFNPTTHIEYTLPIRKEISLVVYDVLGHKVTELVQNEMKNAGTYKAIWDGKDMNGKYVSSGTYIYSLKFGNFSKTKRVTFIK
jgi:hypothetical protein